ncbi:MAG TPA: hypothetical protein VI522_07130, partial [Gammaproteobacteria bacterium]|nr:hypothetical protein [Gammaproteobacteria bacterium]
MRDIVESIKTITVRSVSQKVLNYNTVVFEGGVEVEIDHHLHVWADYVEVDKADQLLCATADPGSFVTLEGEGFFVRAQRIEVKCNDRTVKAEGVYAQFDGIYIRAALAEKLSEDD